MRFFAVLKYDDAALIPVVVAEADNAVF